MMSKDVKHERENDEGEGDHEAELSIKAIEIIIRTSPIRLDRAVIMPAPMALFVW